MELTLPGLAQSVVLTRTSGRASAMPPGETLTAFAATGATLAVHLSIHVLDRVVAELAPAYGPDCPAAIVYRASWPDQRVIRATLATLEAALGGEAVERTALILVGPALAAEGFDESRLYAPDYDRRFRPGRAESGRADAGHMGGGQAKGGQVDGERVDGERADGRRADGGRAGSGRADGERADG